jgi:hypothetical protein
MSLANYGIEIKLIRLLSAGFYGNLTGNKIDVIKSVSGKSTVSNIAYRITVVSDDEDDKERILIVDEEDVICRTSGESFFARSYCLKR